MNEQKLSWANSSHYEKAHAYLVEQNLPTDNEHLYAQLLESQGLTTNLMDVKKWIRSLSVTLNTKGFKL